MLRTFWFKLLVITVLAGWALVGTNFLFPKFVLYPFYFISLFYYGILAVVVHLIVEPAIKKGQKQFQNAYFGATFLRMFVSLIFLVIWLLINKGITLPEAAVFLIFYFLYTAFEIVILFPKLRPDLKSKE